MTSDHRQLDLDALAETILTGRKLDAIKQVRAVTGWSLAEAQREVDRLEAALIAEDGRSLDQVLEAFRRSLVDGSPSSDSSLDSRDVEIREALDNGNKILAIKHYRERHNVGLAEAKQAIDRMARGRSPTGPIEFAKPKGGVKIGCSGVILFAATAGLSIGLVRTLLFV